MSMSNPGLAGNPFGERYRDHTVTPEHMNHWEQLYLGSQRVTEFVFPLSELAVPDRNPCGNSLGIFLSTEKLELSLNWHLFYVAQLKRCSGVNRCSAFHNFGAVLINHRQVSLRNNRALLLSSRSWKPKAKDRSDSFWGLWERNLSNISSIAFSDFGSILCHSLACRFVRTLVIVNYGLPINLILIL